MTEQLQPWQQKMLGDVEPGQQVLIAVPPQPPQTRGHLPASITVTHDDENNTWTVARPGETDLVIDRPNPSLDECARAAHLTNGYWRRAAFTHRTSTWTWVQL